MTHNYESCIVALNIVSFYVEFGDLQQSFAGFEFETGNGHMQRAARRALLRAHHKLDRHLA